MCFFPRPLLECVADDLTPTPTNAPQSPPIFIPIRTVTEENVSDIKTLKNYAFMPISTVKSVAEQPELSPISGSFDFEGSEIDSPLTVNNSKSPTNECPLSELRFETDFDRGRSRPESATNELPLTELNLALFTSEHEKTDSAIKEDLLAQSIKSKPMLSKQGTLDSQTDDISLEVNWDSDSNEVGDKSDKVKDAKPPPKQAKKQKEKRLSHRSFSDPNILDTDIIQQTKRILLLEKLNETLLKDGQNLIEDDDNSNLDTLTPTQSPCIPFSFYPPLDSVPPDLTSDSHYLQDLHNRVTSCSCMFTRTPSTLLSFFTSPPKYYGTSRSFSNPIPDITDPNVSNYSETSNSVSAKRHRHSIAGQMSYFKMLGFGYGGPLAFKKLAGGSTNSLFSTAVISGSSSAPNLRDMIPSTASASGKNIYIYMVFFYLAL